ncbi:ubp1-associated protein 2a [Quercus suber]|uniref:Ubp1-associated protein 2a n=1 Tax=Quercus suber TaxID=58331 RepID=A0AAW0IL83_QUESU
MALIKKGVKKHPNLIEIVHELADADPAHRKIFIHGLSWDTTVETLTSVFGKYGEIKDCKAITDRVSRYGFSSPTGRPLVAAAAASSSDKSMEVLRKIGSGCFKGKDSKGVIKVEADSGGEDRGRASGREAKHWSRALEPL